MQLHATPPEKARNQILHQLKGKLVVANAIKHDLAPLQILEGQHIPSNNIGESFNL